MGWVGESCVAYFALVYELVYFPPRILYWRVWINIVHLVKVDVVCLKPGKRLLNLSSNRLWSEIHVAPPVPVAYRATFGEDESILSPSFEGLPYDPLCPPHP